MSQSSLQSSSSGSATTARITIDTFYEKQKELYDICGVFINKDKYSFIDVLARYLTDIVGLIDVEIKNSARNSMINWREKKNPKLLSRLINSDDNVNLINLSMNKVTATNYKNIVAEITDALISDNPRKLPDYSKFLFDVVIKKCMVDEAFAKDYIRFLFGFGDSIAKHINEHIKTFIQEVAKFLTTNEGLKEYIYFHYVKDVTLWRNIGVIYSNIFSMQPQAGVVVTASDICSSLNEQFRGLFNSLDWLPVNMDELNGRIYLVLAVMENLLTDIWWVFDDKNRKLFSEILTLTYACNSIPNKIKFKVLDLQDMIKNIKPLSAAVEPVVSTVQILVTVPAKLDDVVAPVNNINIWETRKQQMTVNPVVASVIQLETPKLVSAQHNESKGQSNNYRRERDASRRPGTSGASGANGANDSRRRGDDRMRKSNNSKKEHVEEIRVHRNMFSGLESSESNDEHDAKKLNAASSVVEDDGFVTVEKKSKNVYKPKKTPELALEGSKIYAGSSSNASNASKSANGGGNKRRH